MRVTEQIDALESLGGLPVSHLCSARRRGLMVIPAPPCSQRHGHRGRYLTQGRAGLTTAISSIGARLLLPAARPVVLAHQEYCFAARSPPHPCYLGFNTQQGAERGGRATTTRWYHASVAILMLDRSYEALLGAK